MHVDLIDFDSYSDLKEIQADAEKLGIDAVILAKKYSKSELKELKEKLKAVKSEKVSFYTCQVIDRPDINEARKFKNLTDFVAVDGKNINLNKFAVNGKAIDFLLQPVSSGKLEVDTAIARLAKQNKVRVAFLFCDFLSAKGFRQSQLFKNTFMVVKLLKKFGAEALFFSGAKNSFGLRAPKDLKSLAVLFGFTAEQAKRLVERLPEHLIKEKMKRG